MSWLHSLRKLFQALTRSPASERQSQKKRKANQDRLVASQAISKPTPSINYLTLPSATQITEDEAVEEVPEEEVVDELYCTLNSNVVGIQYYKGLVGPGEQVALIREPTNRFDKNAIQVMNISQVQVGHIPRKVAEKLAPLLDRRRVNVEGVIKDGNLTGRSGYTLSITLRIYGAQSERDSLEPLLIWATPGQRGFPSRKTTSSASSPSSGAVPSYSQAGTGSLMDKRPVATGVVQSAAQQQAMRKQQEALRKAAELKQMLNTLEKVDDEGRRSSLLDTLCSNEDILNLPLHPNPPSVRNRSLKVDLLRHQSQALQWCIEREYPTIPKKETDKPVQFWQLRKNGNKVSFVTPSHLKYQASLYVC
ncbi:hypothetical protein H0H87_000722 [Tephrocybe sp. NHM501043]|nr:hypothetical protein H0H87_000722 [Tephrocybe sp. NHM501043]